MAKRKRAMSSVGSACSLPLTRHNLCRLQNSLDDSRPLMPPREKNKLDDRIKLESYRIYVDEGREFPPPLAHLIDTVVRRPRDPAVPVSPNASKIVNSRRHAALENKSLARMIVAPSLLFVGEAELVNYGVPGVSGITYKQDIGLNEFFLPPAPHPGITKRLGRTVFATARLMRGLRHM
jgi:hypothetical protein